MKQKIINKFLVFGLLLGGCIAFLQGTANVQAQVQYQPQPQLQVPSNNPQNNVLNVASNSATGNYLTGSNGKTLYVNSNDTPNSGVSTCNGQCAQIWIPYTVQQNTPLNTGDNIQGTVSTITRQDGTMQVTYNGKPLYYFSGDLNLGDTHGIGQGQIWSIVRP